MPESKPGVIEIGRRREVEARRRRSKAVAAMPAGAASPFRGATPEELAALDALGKEGVWRVDGNDLKLTNLDKALFEPPPRPTTSRSPSAS